MYRYNFLKVLKVVLKICCYIEIWGIFCVCASLAGKWGFWNIFIKPWFLHPYSRKFVTVCWECMIFAIVYPYIEWSLIELRQMISRGLYWNECYLWKFWYLHILGCIGQLSSCSHYQNAYLKCHMILEMIVWWSYFVHVS